MAEFFQMFLGFTADLGYFGIVFLMTLESTFIPYPSELVIPPAAYLAYSGEMNLILVIVAGTVGSMIGATINYVIGMVLGRTVVYGLAKRNFAKYLLIKHHHIVKSENLILKYGNVATFIGRLIPGVRHLISLPAGFAKMPFKWFLFYTFLGAGLWVTFLAVNGYLLAAKL